MKMKVYNSRDNDFERYVAASSAIEARKLFKVPVNWPIDTVGIQEVRMLTLENPGVIYRRFHRAPYRDVSCYEVDE